MSTHRAILIAGPTAAGKSALASAIARRVGGTVVNADSMQVYRDLAILTARPTASETAEVEHALYGYVSGAEAYSVGRWLADMEAVLAGLRQRDRVPVIVGGTGLYFKALVEGLSPVPPVPAEIRERWRAESARLAPQALHRLLQSRDPATAARLRDSDPQRLVRALEVLEATGRGLAEWQREPGRPLVAEDGAVRLLLAPEREALYARSEVRLEAMLAAGALEEVAGLARLGLSPELPVMRALGVPPLLAVVAGRLGVEAALAEAKRDTRHYIKRQITWSRRHMIAWTAVSAQRMETIIEDCFTLIRH